MRRTTFSLIVVSLLGCSSSREVAARRDPLAQLRRFDEFAVHLEDRGLAHAAPWRQLDVALETNTAKVARADEPSAFVELVALDQKDVGAEVVGAARILHGALPSTDVVQVVEPARYEEYRVIYDAAAPSVLRYRVRRGPGIASLRVENESVLALSADGRVRLSSAPAFAIDDHGTRRALTTRLEGDVLELALDTAGLAYPISIDPLWTPTPDLALARTKHAAVALPSGKAMIAGGMRSVGAGTVNTTLAYDPATNAWSSLANLPGQMDSFVMVVLSGGKVLATGGNKGGLPNRSADLYDPATNTWSAGGSPGSTPYRTNVVAALSGDRALAVSTDGLLFTLSTNTWVPAGTTTVTHSGHTATTIAGDKVLVVGGATVADLWDPATMTFGGGGTLIASRSQHTATLLPSGKVLIAGGDGQSSAEVYDPTTKTFAAAGAMAAVRTAHTAALLPGGRVMVIGGRDGAGAVLSTTEIYDAASNSWSVSAPMSAPRVNHTATALPGPKVVVAGGDNGTTAWSTAEVFEPIAKGSACVSDSECGSGFCADGVCCDTACKGQCEACDVTGAVGTCTAVKGAPHGARTACEAGGTGVCARACDGDDHAKCNFAATSVVCAAATCAAGTATTESKCDGAGGCPTPTTTSCAPYACGGTACKTKCGTSADCTGGTVCNLATATCIAAVDSHCSVDRLLEVPSDPASPTKSCAPFACDTSTGKCASRCASSLDCASGSACDTASGTCAPAAAPAAEGDSGGCSTGRSGPSSAVMFALLLVLGIVRNTNRER